MTMPGSDQVRLQNKLASLQKRAADGDQAAKGQAALLATYLDGEADALRKKADDRCKILVGAMVVTALAAGRPVQLDGARSLLDAMNAFLVRDKEREAVLGTDISGSESFRRVTSIQESSTKQNPQHPTRKAPTPKPDY